MTLTIRMKKMSKEKIGAKALQPYIHPTPVCEHATEFSGKKRLFYMFYIKFKTKDKLRFTYNCVGTF